MITLDNFLIAIGNITDEIDYVNSIVQVHHKNNMLDRLDCEPVRAQLNLVSFQLNALADDLDRIVLHEDKK